LIRVNGRERPLPAAARVSLADHLRDGLRLTGTHLGCEHGVCGACTVLLDGEAVRSCLILAIQAEGREVTTVEGLADPGRPSRLQQAFIDHGAFQCGFCAPGFVMTAEALLRSGRRLDRQSLPELLAGNICRCTGYEPIVAAILEVAGER